MKLNLEFERHLQQGRFFNNQDHVVVAVSTGVDSMVLLDLLQKLPDNLRPQLIVAHVNHQLRLQSQEEEAFIRHYCRAHNLHLLVHQWSQAEHPQTGIEDAARRMRYRFFAGVMRESHASCLVTAHHQNDLAETMLMKLTRGGQLHQLVGIEEQRSFANGRLVRPLLPFTKQELKEYASQNHLKWFEDATNKELTISRNRFRHQIIPLLERENPNLLNALTSYHDQLEMAMRIQRQYALAELRRITVNGQLKVAALREKSPAEERLLLTAWLEQLGILNLSWGQVGQLVKDINNRHLPQFQRLLAPNMTLIKNYSELIVKNVNQLTEKSQNQINSVVKLGRWYLISQTQQLAVATQRDFFGQEAKVQEMWLAPHQFPLTLRRWQSTDRLPLKNGGYQKVERVLIDQKVPLSERDRQLVVVDANSTVVWVVERKWGWFSRPQNYLSDWQQLFIGIRINRGEKNE